MYNVANQFDPITWQRSVSRVHTCVLHFVDGSCNGRENPAATVPKYATPNEREEDFVAAALPRVDHTGQESRFIAASRAIGRQPPYFRQRADENRRLHFNSGHSQHKS